MKQTGQPVVLTVNAKAELVVQDAELYQKLLELLQHLETVAGIRKGLEDIDAGRSKPVEEFVREIGL